MYGHRREGDCSDSELVVPFSAPNEAIAQMSSFADEVNPKGRTPISRSLRAALEDFGDRPGEIVLISDGIETCDEDPCALMREWREKDVDIRVHVVGLGLQNEERAAMQCISDAAGTTYHDAQSVDELIAGMEEIRGESDGEPIEAAAPSEADGTIWRALDILATNEAGESMRVQGTARWEGGDPIEVSSGSHNRVPAGEVAVTVGVRTRNGNLYKPVTASTTVAPSGDTDLRIVVPEPPSVKAKFLERGEEISGSFVTAYQADEKAFGFRHIDRAYLEPDTYEFRAAPNADNELSVAETFAAGDHKEIVFELTHTVHTQIKMIAKGTDFRFSTNLELWQDGEEKYGVHARNGVRALPGTYDVRLPLRLTPYLHEGLVLGTEEGKEYTIEVPVGHVTFRYENVDGSPIDDTRVFPERKNEDGRWVSDSIKTSGTPVPLVPGEYRVRGWSHRGNFDDVLFEIAVGDNKDIVLRDKGE